MTTRLHGLDLVRLVSFFAIATFHVSLIHYHTADIAIAGQSLVIRAAEQFSRLLAFSGFTICFLSSLLTAFSGSSLTKRIRLFSFLIIGWAVFSALMSAPEDTWFVWDIYPLIFSGVLLCSIVQLYSKRVLRVLGLLGFVLLCIPIWEFRDHVHLPGAWQTVLGFGTCPDDLVEWPVLPWIGLVTFGYWIGNELRHKWAAGDQAFFRMGRKEMTAWGVLLAASTLRFGDYYGIQLGQAFTCEAYRQPPLIWWSHFIWPLFLMRLSFEPRVQARLSRFAAARWVSSLAISRKFWLAYFANYCFCYALSALVTYSGVESTAWNVPTIAFIAVFLVPMTELIVRFILLMASYLNSAFKTVFTLPGESKPAVGERGASLMMVMIITAAMGGMIGGITVLVKNRVDARILNSTLQGRQVVFDQVKDSAGAPDAIKASAQSNATLKGCVFDNSKEPVQCARGVDPTTATWVAMDLKVPMEAGTAPVTIATNTANVPSASFNWRGLRGCDPTGVNKDTCVYGARAIWWAECQGKAASCPQAFRIYVIPQIYTLASSRNSKRAANRVDIAAFPSAADIAQEKANIRDGKPLRFAASVVAKEAAGNPVPYRCPVGMLVTGTMDDGSVKCDCEHGYRQTGFDGATGWPVCTAISNCVPPKILVGIDEKGAAKCVEPKEEDYVCGATRAVGSNGTVACASGERIRQLFVQNDCLVLPQGAPERNQHVDCGNMKFRCCKVKK